tara:strand:- start:114731 stop:115765 length:1035 start_codon:yes stop_codon:yes gene_type:complete
MLEFFSNYGLFLAKTLTIVIAIIIVLVTMASLALKNKIGSGGQLSITNLNEEIEETQATLKSEILSKSELKAWKKSEKKRHKQESKDKSKSSEAQPKLFVIRFDGDVKASETEKLTECVNAILESASEQDEVLLVLESAGGFVHSYGLAASQLSRIRENNLRLTVAIDKCAASGGYLMACVATKIIAARFAIIGSIGVIGQMPNFNKLLKKNNIEYEMHTAGNFKRTLTMFGENTDKQRHKFIEEIEVVHGLFKDYISTHRPQVDIQEVATGEHWHAIQAFEKNLVDKLQTSDDFILASIKNKQVFEIDYQEKQSFSEKLSSKIAANSENILLNMMTRWGLFKT